MTTLNEVLHEILEARASKHGDFVKMSEAIEAIENQMKAWGLDELPAYQRHALQLISVKIGRILVGNNNFDDHWRDIAGYATKVIENLPDSE